MWAKVDSEGAFVAKSAGVLSVQVFQTSPGYYYVRFNRNITTCALTATPATANASSSSANPVTADTILVALWNGGGLFGPNYGKAGFSVVVYC